MAVKFGAEGRRYVEMNVEVPGTPEEVWRVFATGPGMTCWFAPAKIEERVGGRLELMMGEGMVSVGEVTAWEPPVRMGYVEREWMPGAPECATDIEVKPTGSGKCAVRMTHTLVTDAPDWDSSLEMFETGWPGFFRILHIYMSDHRGEDCHPVQLLKIAMTSGAEAWEQMKSALGLPTAGVGETGAIGAAPGLAGKILSADVKPTSREMTILMSSPIPGIAQFGAFECGGATMCGVSLYLYGDEGRDAAPKLKPGLAAAMDAAFPPPPAE